MSGTIETVVTFLASTGIASGFTAFLVARYKGKIVKQVKEIEKHTAEVNQKTAETTANAETVQALTDQLRQEYERSKHAMEKVEQLGNDVIGLRRGVEDCEDEKAKDRKQYALDKAELKTQFDGLLNMRANDIARFNETMRKDLTQKVRTVVKQEIRKSTPSMPGVSLVDSSETPLSEAAGEDPNRRR